MRIGIEGDRMWANPFGIGRFVRETAGALEATAPEHEYVIFTLTRQAQPSRRFWSPQRLGRGLRRLAWLQVGLPWQAARAKLDVLFCPDYLAPLRAPCPVVVMVHDLLFAVHPAWGEKMVNWELRCCMPLVLRRAARVVTPSEFVRKQLVDVFRYTEERVVVVPEGVGSLFRPPDRQAVESPVTRHGLVGVPYVLSVGMWSPRKNLARLLEAFAMVRDWYGGILAVVGGGGWSRQPLRDAIRRFGLEDRVRLLGYVPDEELAALYAAADLFVFPSLYEGFGLPVLEAMACGCPVIASNAASIPEVADGAAVLVDPYDVSGLAHAIRDVVQDSSRAAHLRERGLQHAQRFQWAKTAKQLVAVFEAAAA